MRDRSVAPSPLVLALMVFVGGVSFGLDGNHPWLLLIGLVGPLVVLAVYFAFTLLRPPR
jgi:hypothetical protein